MQTDNQVQTTAHPLDEEHSDSYINKTANINVENFTV